MGCKSVYAVFFLVILAPTWCARMKSRESHSKLDSLDSQNASVAMTYGDDEVTHLQVAVQSVQSHLSKLATAFKAKWPEVQESLGEFAEGTRDKAYFLAKDVLVWLDNTVCDPVNQANFKETLSEFRSNLDQVASFMASLAAEHGPKAKDAIKTFAAETPGKLDDLRKMIHKEVKDSDALQSLFLKAKSHFEEFKNSAFERLESEERLMRWYDTIGELSDALMKISATIARTAHTVYKSGPVQGMIKEMQRGIGKLITHMADKWPELKAVVIKFSNAARDKAHKAMLKIGEEMNMCLPDKRQRVVEVSTEIMARVKHLSRVIWDNTNLVKDDMVEKWPVVKEKFNDFVDSVSKTVNAISSSTAIMLGPQGKKVQGALSQVLKKVEALRKGIMQHLSSPQLAGIAEGAMEQADKVLSQLGQILQRIGHGVTGIGKGIRGLGRKIPGFGRRGSA